MSRAAGRPSSRCARRRSSPSVIAATKHGCHDLAAHAAGGRSRHFGGGGGGGASLFGGSSPGGGGGGGSSFFGGSSPGGGGGGGSSVPAFGFFLPPFLLSPSPSGDVGSASLSFFPPSSPP